MPRTVRHFLGSAHPQRGWLLLARNISLTVFKSSESLFVGPLGPGLDKNHRVEFHLRAETRVVGVRPLVKLLGVCWEKCWKIQEILQLIIGFAWLALKDEIWITDKICPEILPQSH